MQVVKGEVWGGLSERGEGEEGGKVICLYITVTLLMDRGTRRFFFFFFFCSIFCFDYKNFGYWNQPWDWPPIYICH